jgi:predicted DNA-binding transcriptional regulator AlpA
VKQTAKTQGTVDAQRATDILAGTRFLTDVEVEVVYGFSKKTLRNWRLLGRGPVFKKIGSSVRYDIRALEAWIESLPTGGVVFQHLS